MQPEIDFIQVGSGPLPVLALHASGTGAGSLVRLAKSLGDSASVLIPNLNGYGNSRAPADQPNNPLAKHLAIATAALDQMTGRRVHVFAHSMGAWVALNMAAQAGQRIASLTLAEPVCFGLLHEVDDADVIAEDRESVAGLLSAADTGVARFIEYWNGTPWETMPATVRSGLDAIRAQIREEALAISADRTPVGVYAAIRCPTQILFGTRSNPVALRVCQRFQEQRPDWSQTGIEQAGHMLPIERPAAVAEALLSWINRSVYAAATAADAP